MRILIASDKFKGSLSSAEFGDIVTIAIKEMAPHYECVIYQMSDGGDGFLQVLDSYLDLKRVACIISDPLGRKIDSEYLYDTKNNSAYLESALACGLTLLTDNEQDCKQTNSYGLGEMILHSISKGAKKIYIGLGGSSTNDGGSGMAAALGYEFFDQENRSFTPNGATLQNIKFIENSKVNDLIEETEFCILNDVKNPLLGPNGCTYTYAIQKGANISDLEPLELGMKNLANFFEKQVCGISEQEGAGAAGGLGAGSLYFLKAKILNGSDFVIGISGIESEIDKADLLVTGEGKLDSQSIFGKIPIKIAGLTNNTNCQNVVIAGLVKDKDKLVVYFDQIIQLLDFAKDKTDSIKNVRGYLKMATKKLIKNLANGKT